MTAYVYGEMKHQVLSGACSKGLKIVKGDGHKLGSSSLGIPLAPARTTQRLSQSHQGQAVPGAWRGAAAASAPGPDVTDGFLLVGGTGTHRLRPMVTEQPHGKPPQKFVGYALGRFIRRIVKIDLLG
jgi:hypothetical protein